MEVCWILDLWCFYFPTGSLSDLFKPSSKRFYLPFQGGTSFVDVLCFFCLVFVMPLCACLFVPCGHLLGKG